MTDTTISAIITENAPAAIGPYSQAVVAGNLVYLSGQIPLDPNSGQLVSGGIRAQTEQVLHNIDAILHACGLTSARIVKTEVYLTDMGDFAVVNELYANWLDTEVMPARHVVEVSALPRQVSIEIACVAMR